MFQNEPDRGDHHGSLEAFQKAAENGCRICRSLAPRYSSKTDPRYTPGHGPKFTYEFEWYRSYMGHWRIYITQEGELQPMERIVYIHGSHVAEVPDGYDRFVNNVRADLELEPSRVRQDFLPLRDIPDDTGHEDVAQTAKGWLVDCKSNHTICEKIYETREPNWYPERLIYVGNSAQSPRLVLRESGSLRGTYVALSHCWGAVQEPLILTSTNIGDFQREIPLHILPASFRDAILTCRRLDIPYIWIDSLCILQSGQGSKADWLFHVSVMHKVYLNCELNIAIDVAKNPHEGAFRSRDPVLLQDCRVWTPFHAPIRLLNSTDWMLLRENGWSAWTATPLASGSQCCEFLPARNQARPMGLCTVFTEQDFSVSRYDLPLNTRAWVLQERLMSPRTLHFQEDRISWECQRSTLSEYFPSGTVDGDGKGFDCLIQPRYNITKGNRARQHFYDVIWEYTDRQLTCPNADKLVAFANIAREYACSLGGEYCAGIFRSTMPRALLWVTINWVEGSSYCRATEYRAPSWSWASIDGCVRLYVGDGDRECTSLADVERVDINLVDPTNRYGQIKSALLTVTGPVATWQALNDVLTQWTESVCPKFEDFVDHNVYKDFLIYPDDVRTIEHKGDLVRTEFTSPGDIRFMAISRTSKDYDDRIGLGCWGLILLELDDGQYRRIGAWRARSDFLEKHEFTESWFRPLTVTII